MTPDELIAKYEGLHEIAFKTCMESTNLTYIEWGVAYRAWQDANRELQTAKLMLAVCRSQGL